MAVKVAEEWLNICGGCEVTILDIGEPLLDLLGELEFVHMPVLMDHKYFGQTGEKQELEIPEADVGIISGGVRNEKEKHVAEEMRKKCKTLIALGSCACFGGIPALANMYTLEDLYEKVYYDNLDRVFKTERYDTSASGNLIAREETRYDDLGRVYQTIRYAVDPSTGSVGNRLTDNTWYDAAGNVMKQLPALKPKNMARIPGGTSCSSQSFR